LLLDSVNTCSIMEFSNDNGKFNWRTLPQTGILL
jgi:hypothetical protein